MPVFNTFFKVAKKYISSSMIYVIVFVIVCIFFTNLGEDSTKEYKLSSCKIVVFDYDQTEESQRLIDYLSSLHTVILDEKDDKEVLQDMLYYHEYAYVLYIDKGFSQTGKLSNIKREGTNVGVYIDGQISSYLSSYEAAKQAGLSNEEAYELTLKALDSSSLVAVKGKEANRKGESIYYFFQYIAYVLLMTMLSVMGPILIAFNKKEVKDRLAISSLSNKRKNFEIFLGSLVMSLLLWAFFIVLSIVLAKGQFGEKELLASLNSLIFAMIVAGMVSILGNFNISGAPFAMMTNVVALTMCFLGGIFVPMQFFGSTLQMVSKLFPTHWFIVANDRIYNEEGLAKIFTCFGIELLFAVAFFAISLVVSKQIKEKRAA